MLLVAVVATVGLTACKKDWTCKCTDTFTDFDGTMVSEEFEYTIKDASKVEAQAACRTADIEDEDGDVDEGCELDKK